MKLLVVLVASLALCAGSAIPLVPGDNSHFVKGESRYIWFPDGEGTPVLVDLQAPPEPEHIIARQGSSTTYYLYTRSNYNSPQVLTLNNANSVSNSHYSGSKQTKVIVHGWNNDGNAQVGMLIKNAFLDSMDVNVIIVDWGTIAQTINYISAVNGVPSVGQYLGDFVNFLINTAGGNLNNFHLIGHSLGAHVVGVAGRRLNGQVSRVTGMDPAGPLWWSNSERLSEASGQYVEAIHTDGGSLGIGEASAHADFFPNGGRNPQPGCSLSTCSHSRAYEFMASSIRTNHLVGRACSNLAQAQSNTCTGSSLNMGNGIVNKRGSGLYALTTAASFPF